MSLRRASGPGETGRGKHREEDLNKAGALKELAFQIFQVGLAHRRVQDIMESGDLAMVAWYRELEFVHCVLSDLDSLLRRVRRAGTEDLRQEAEAEARLGEAGEQRGRDSGRSRRALQRERPESFQDADGGDPAWDHDHEGPSSVDGR